MSSASRSGGVACGIQPSPTRATRRSAGLPEPPIQIGGCGCCTGRGLWPTSAYFQRAPSCGAHSSSHEREDRVDRLVGDRAALRERNAERVELAFHVTGADAEQQATARQRVDRRERLRGLERMPVRRDVHVGHQARALACARRGTRASRPDRTTWSTSSRPARAGWRRDGTRRRRGSRRRRTPARRAPCRRRCRLSLPRHRDARRERLDRELDPVGDDAVGNDRNCLRSRWHRRDQPGQTTDWSSL